MTDLGLSQQRHEVCGEVSLQVGPRISVSVGGLLALGSVYF